MICRPVAIFDIFITTIIILLDHQSTLRFIIIMSSCPVCLETSVRPSSSLASTLAVKVALGVGLALDKQSPCPLETCLNEISLHSCFKVLGRSCTCWTSYYRVKSYLPAYVHRSATLEMRGRSH